MTAANSDREEAIRQVVRAFNVPGYHQGYHYRQVRRLQEKWPLLHRALRDLSRIEGKW